MNFRRIIMRSLGSAIVIAAMGAAAGGAKGQPPHQTVWTVTLDATGPARRSHMLCRPLRAMVRIAQDQIPVHRHPPIICIFVRGIQSNG